MMGRIGIIPSVFLFVGALLVIIAGFASPGVPTELPLNYIELGIGLTLIVIAVVLIARKRS